MEFLHFTLVDLIDIILVAAVIFVIFRWIKGSSAMNIFIAIIILFLVRVLATALNMRMISALLGAILDVGALAIIIIFQPEIRRFLNNIGRTAGDNTLIRRLLRRQRAEGLDSDNMSQVVSAVEQMASHKTGALIVIRRRDNLQSIIATGDSIDARISERLIMNIFFKNSPLHDGAMVIGDNHIIAARCTLPLTERLDLPAHYGMRHRAAVGLAEQCDADVIVVSEETGQVSFVRGRSITLVETSATLKLKLQNNDQ
ncbi:MAG: diadenylate cyclase CdaA [Bacteroidales bacterium]|nr:diadenylate cyclase CdaA [Bacteroidales bacterium]MBP5383316.1 diadenylate cyclase CdaA [Bacteroidales bacterium]MBP5521667.1 diadenylate cyclase CdaA [Bacteroidales bacterium]